MDETQPLLTHAISPAEFLADTQTQDDHTHIVAFRPEGDPENPLEWPLRYRYGIVFLLAFMAFTVTFTCIGVVPVASHIVRDLEGKDDKSASVLLVTIWELGEAAGPLIIAPLSETHGRYIVYNVANTAFIIGVLLAVLSPSSGVLIFARFLTGCAVASNVLSPAVLGDMFPPESRGTVMGAVFLAPLLGGAIGPAIAGAIAESMGWRSILWMALILAVVAEVAFLMFFRETYPVLILRRRAAWLREETGDKSLKTAFDDDSVNPSGALWRSIVRPAHIFISSPILQALSLWNAVAFTLFYIMSITLPDILHDIYGFTPAMTGTAFGTFSLGCVFGIVICNTLVDRIYVKLRQRQKEKEYPEGRLPLSIIGAFLLPASVVFYGFAAEKRWPVEAFLTANVLQGLTLLTAEVPMMTYVTDAFGVYSASAMTAVLVTRCLMGTFLPLATEPLTSRLGYGLGFLVIAGLIWALAPIPPLIWWFGTRLRQRSSFSKTAMN